MEQQLDLELSGRVGKVYIVFQHDGYEHCNVIGVFDNRKAAQELVDLRTHDDDQGLFYNHYLKQFTVNKSIDKGYGLK